MSFRRKLIKYSEEVIVVLPNGGVSGSVNLAQTVIPANTVIHYNWQKANDAGGSLILFGRVDLKSDGTQILVASNVAPNHNINIYVTVTEYYSGIIRNLSRGYIDLNLVTTASVSITRDTNYNYALDFLGSDTLNSGGFSDDRGSSGLYVSGNNVVAIRDTADANTGYGKVGYQYYEM